MRTIVRASVRQVVHSWPDFQSEQNPYQLLTDLGLTGPESVREAAHGLRCMGCGQALVVVVDHQGRGLHWYPAPGAGHLDKDVDEIVASCYDEACGPLA